MEALKNLSRKFFGFNSDQKSEVVKEEVGNRKRQLEEEVVSKNSLNPSAKRARMEIIPDDVEPSTSTQPVVQQPSPVQTFFSSLQSWFKVKTCPDLVECSEVAPTPRVTIQATPPILYSTTKLDTDEVELLKMVNPKGEVSSQPISAEMGCARPDEYYFEVLTTEEIVKHMVESIKEVNTVVQIPITTVRILLNYFKWDKEKLMERFYSDDQEAMFDEAHVVSPYKKNPALPKATKRPISGSSVVECEICCLSLTKSMMTGLECGHLYCTSCWTEYLTTKIMDEGASQMIECPGNCNIVVNDQTVMTLISDPRVKLKYQHLITNSFVQCNRLLRWCPSPDCSNAVKVQHVEPKPVKCRCSHVFCFSCSENWHDPVRCHLIKKWIKKCDDDSETSNWISANTKECPKCGATIEKDGGCNHMICKNQSCKSDFCWVCLGPWEPHASSWYNCNRFDEDEAKVNRDNQEKSRSALQRYLFYCNRYMNHLQSLKFESKLYDYAMVKDKMEDMQQHNMSWIEVQLLKKSLDILCECRRTLMYTYVFSYYLRKNNQSAIFEDNQKDLESATEHLSEYLERDISAENLVDIKQKVQDKYRYCDSRRKILLAHVHEGYEKEWWEYTEANC